MKQTIFQKSNVHNFFISKKKTKQLQEVMGTSHKINTKKIRVMEITVKLLTTNRKEVALEPSSTTN